MVRMWAEKTGLWGLGMMLEADDRVAFLDFRFGPWRLLLMWMDGRCVQRVIDRLVEELKQQS